MIWAPLKIFIDDSRCWNEVRKFMPSAETTKMETPFGIGRLHSHLDCLAPGRRTFVGSRMVRVEFHYNPNLRLSTKIIIDDVVITKVREARGAVHNSSWIGGRSRLPRASSQSLSNDWKRLDSREGFRARGHWSGASGSVAKKTVAVADTQSLLCKATETFH